MQKGENMTKAYCVKCKKKDITMKDEQEVTTAKGGRAAKGVCPTCGTGMMKFLPKK